VGMSDEGLEPRLVPRGCDQCTSQLRAALMIYNRTADLGALAALDCPCHASIVD